MIPVQEMGLPQEFEALRNVVFKYQVKNTLTIKSSYLKYPPEVIAQINAQNRANFKAAREAGLPLPKTLPQWYWKHEPIIKQVKVPFAGFGLSFARNLVFAYFNEYKGFNDGKFEYLYDRPDFMLSTMERVHYIANTSIYKEENGNWVSKTSTNQPLTLKLLGKNEKKTHAEWASLLGMTEQAVRDATDVYNEGYECDPNVEMCDIFLKISRSGDQYTQQVYINGLPEEQVSIGSLKAPWTPFSTGHNFVGTWILYNDSEKGTGASPTSMSSGNFGQSFKMRIGQKSDPNYKVINVVQTTGDNSYDAATHTVSYNPSRQNCVLEFNIEFLPAQGKQWAAEAYFDIVQNKVRRNIVGPAFFE